jgi:cytochrome P450
MKVLVPFVQQQLEIIEKEFSEEKRPVSRQDILTWIIVDALRKKEPKEGLVTRICSRIFVVAFASIETTTLTMTNVLFDLAASDPSLKVWEGLAEEANRMLGSFTGRHLDYAGVSGLIRADSSLKEALRLRTSIKALAMQVTSPDGLVLDGSDVKLPMGSRLSISAWGIHHDEDIYANAAMYDAFRFSRPLEEGTASQNSSKENENRHSMVSASENYLPFGMGRHSCPGRYFASVQLKLFLAYIATNYDVKLIEERPKFVTMGHFPVPPMKGKLLIRRKGTGMLPPA